MAKCAFGAQLAQLDLVRGTVCRFPARARPAALSQRSRDAHELALGGEFETLLRRCRTALSAYPLFARLRGRFLNARIAIFCIFGKKRPGRPLTRPAPPSGFCPHLFEHTGKKHSTQTGEGEGCQGHPACRPPEWRVPWGRQRARGPPARLASQRRTRALETHGVIQTPVHAQVHAVRVQDAPTPAPGARGKSQRPPRPRPCSDGVSGHPLATAGAPRVLAWPLFPPA